MHLNTVGVEQGAQK